MSLEAEEWQTLAESLQADLAKCREERVIFCDRHTTSDFIKECLSAEPGAYICPVCDGNRRIHQLEAERDEALQKHYDSSEENLKIRRQWPASDGSPMGIAMARITALEAGLKKYGKHYDISCGAPLGLSKGTYPCCCGLTDLIGGKE